MKRGAACLQGYNCQIAVDGVAPVILAEAVTFVCLCSNLLKLVNVPLSLQAEPA